MTDIRRQNSINERRKKVNVLKSKTRFKLHSFLKRLMDIIFSFFGLLILSPVFGFVAIGIKRDTDGPVYYHGLRVGRHGKVFKMYKFRTMYETPEAYNGPSITGKDDARITPFGSWLRDTKLNELPQLWNVLKGDMSLVGPRPEVEEVVENWSEDVRQEVLALRPGVTSPASVVYRDEEKLLESKNVLDEYMKQILPDKLRLDQLYVRNFSILSDLDVIFVTLIALLPALRRIKFKERSFYSGLFYRFYHWIISWFMVDVFITTFMVGLSGVVWRVSTVINLGPGTYLLVALGMALLISVINTLFGLHTIQWTTASPTYVLDIGASIAITCTILWSINRFLIVTPWIPFSMFWLIGVMTFIGLVAIRYRERLFTGIANRWLILRGASVAIGERVLVVGAGDLGEMAVWLLHRSQFRNAFGIVGIVDDDIKKHGIRLTGYKVLGGTDNIPRLVEKYDIGLIVFAISNIQVDKRQQVLEQCHSTAAHTLEIPDLINVLDSSIKQQTPAGEQ
jgi:lipopolysaccharide/colanic/teichoic acid biosynthesis glycosyltransferase